MSIYEKATLDSSRDDGDCREKGEIDLSDRLYSSRSAAAVDNHKDKQANVIRINRKILLQHSLKDFRCIMVSSSTLG